MNEYLLPEDSQLLDRLVDGELSDAERNELLLRLERTPDGWRRCALAFLEGQAWRSEAKSWAASPSNVERPALPSAAQRGWSRSAAWTPIALAAGLVVAVGWWDYRSDFAGREEGELLPQGGAVAAAVDAASAPRSIRRPSAVAASASPANVRLVVDGGPDAAERVVEVPLVEPDRLNEALFGPWSQSVPPEVLQMLEQSGHQVVRERRLVPIDLRDGRRVIVPMDQVEIRPVSSREYQ